jgi:hypothetical protein
MLEFNKRELKFKYGGEEQVLRFPSVRDLSEYQKQYKKASEEEQAEVVVHFLVKLGLKEKVAGELEAHHVEKILAELTAKDSEEKED